MYSRYVCMYFCGTYEGCIDGIHKSLLAHLQEGLGMVWSGGPEQGTYTVGQLCMGQSMGGSHQTTYIMRTL